MAHLSSYAREQIYQLPFQPEIAVSDVLSKERIREQLATKLYEVRDSSSMCISTYGTIQPLPKSGRPCIVTPEIHTKFDR